MESKTVELETVTVSYGDSGGTNTELIFVHGYPARWEDYEPFLSLLSEHFRVFAPSMRGMGQSGRASSYRVADYIADMREFITKVTNPPVFVVGQGGGPWFAAAAAATHPSLVRALVSLDEAFSPEANIAGNQDALAIRTGTANALRQARSHEEFLALFAAIDIGDGMTYSDLHPDRFRFLSESLGLLDPETLAHWESMETMTAFLDVPELRALPGAYRGPVLFINGDPDAPASLTPEESDLNIQQYPWAELVVLEGTDSHLAMRENPALLSAPIVEFLLRVAE